jgi:effector-binding domain-containing protein
MKENNISIESIEITNRIISEMESHSFHNHFHILYDICNLIDKDITYLEIGCFAGASASLVSSNNLVKKSYSIDLGQPISRKIPIKNVNNFKNPSCEYTYVEGNSNDVEVIKSINDQVNCVDILLIDGDHSYKGVLNDFKNYEELVCEGGYVVFDDYLDKKHSPEVKPAIDDLIKTLDEKKYEIIGSIKYDLIKMTNLPNHPSSNMFILKKKVNE